MADIFNNYSVDSIEQFKNNAEETNSGRITYTYTDNIVFKEFEKIEEGSLKSTVRKLLNKLGMEEGIMVKISKLVVEMAGEKIAYIFNRSF